MKHVSDRVSYSVLIIVGIVSALVFLLVRMPGAQSSILSTDGPGYVSYLESLLFDGDLDFRDEYARFPWYVSTCVECTATETGLIGNPCSIGPAILWTPFYLLAHIMSVIVRTSGVRVDAHGSGLIYECAVCVGTVVYVTIGCFLTHRLCRRYFAPYPSLLAVLGAYLASSLLHYAVAAPVNSHALSFFTVSLFLLLWHPPRSRTCVEWILLGCAVGLMALVRWQDVLYASVLIVEGIQALKASGGWAVRTAILRRYLAGGLVVALAATVVFLPQLLAWNTLYGSPIAVPQGASFFAWSRPLLLEYLLSTRHGLFTWHPVTMLATLGLVVLWKRDRRVTLALLVPLLLQWYLNSTLSDWWWHSSFGARRFTSAISVFALGIAAIADSLSRRFRQGQLVATAIVAILVGWNLLFDLQFSWGFIPHDEAISMYQLTLGKFEMIAALIRRHIGQSREPLTSLVHGAIMLGASRLGHPPEWVGCAMTRHPRRTERPAAHLGQGCPSSSRRIP